MANCCVRHIELIRWNKTTIFIHQNNSINTWQIVLHILLYAQMRYLPCSTHPALLPKIKHKELNSYIVVQHNNIYSCRINIVLLHKVQRQLMRVMMYRPFSKSYMIFVLGFLHLDTKSTPHKRNIPSTANNGLLLWVDSAAVCNGFKLVFCISVMKAPRAHSTWMSPTWFEYSILIRRKLN